MSEVGAPPRCSAVGSNGTKVRYPRYLPGSGPAEITPTRPVDWIPGVSFEPLAWAENHYAQKVG
jgi:hypothetical protein